MITTQAMVSNFKSSHIIAKVSFSKFNFQLGTKTAFIGKDTDFIMGHSLVLTSNTQSLKTITPHAYAIKNDFLCSLSEGDIILVDRNGLILILWDKKLNPHDALLFITHQCNSNCIMCPQPPKKDEYSFFPSNDTILDYLKNEPIRYIGITGGEPTLKKDDLVKLLKKSQSYFPTATIALLTNAKKLEDFQLAKEIALSNQNITFCISFPSDNEDDFNEIMGVKNYHHTIKAIQNLALLRQRIELRIVIMKQNYKRLLQISEFIYRNFPFISHIAFMGMEVTGHAFDNFNEIDITPQEYNENLLEALIYLQQRDMNVSIYNIPYCLIDMRLWKFSRNSISRWKQIFHTECNLCSKKNECSGLFATTKIKHYDLKAIL